MDLSFSIYYALRVERTLFFQPGTQIINRCPTDPAHAVTDSMRYCPDCGRQAVGQHVMASSERFARVCSDLGENPSEVYQALLEAKWNWTYRRELGPLNMAVGLFDVRLLNNSEADPRGEVLGLGFKVRASYFDNLKDLTIGLPALDSLRGPLLQLAELFGINKEPEVFFSAYES